MVTRFNIYVWKVMLRIARKRHEILTSNKKQDKLTGICQTTTLNYITEIVIVLSSILSGRAKISKNKVSGSFSTLHQLGHS